MTNELNIMRMLPEHVERVYAIELEVFADDPAPLSWFTDSFLDPASYYYVAFWNDELVGYCGMYHNTSFAVHYCKIAAITVKENFRGKGIGKALMATMLDNAKELGLSQAKLEVSTKNDAIKLYKAFGFEVTETIENFYDEIGEDAYIMKAFFKEKPFENVE